MKVGNSLKGSVEVDEECSHAVRLSDALSFLTLSSWARFARLFRNSCSMMASVLFLVAFSSKVNYIMQMKQSSSCRHWSIPPRFQHHKCRVLQGTTQDCQAIGKSMTGAVSGLYGTDKEKQRGKKPKHEFSTVHLVASVVWTTDLNFHPGMRFNIRKIGVQVSLRW